MIADVSTSLSEMPQYQADAYKWTFEQYSTSTGILCSKKKLNIFYYGTLSLHQNRQLSKPWKSHQQTWKARGHTKVLFNYTGMKWKFKEKDLHTLNSALHSNLWVTLKVLKETIKTHFELNYSTRTTFRNLRVSVKAIISKKFILLSA